MTNDKFSKLLHLLATATADKHIQWDLLPDEDMVRARFNPGWVRLGVSGGLHGAYTLWLINSDGDVAAEWTVRRDDATAYEMLQRIYKSAVMVARGGDRLLDDMLILNGHLAPDVV